MRIVFVCTGNTCRSCMAEAIAKHYAESYKLNMDISSAGIYATAGEKASLNAAKVMEEKGFDVSCHIARPLSHNIINEADLILAMTYGHRSAVLSIYPFSKGKVFTLTEYVGETGDIADPFGGSVNTYRDCANELERIIIRIFEKIKESYNA